MKKNALYYKSTPQEASRLIVSFAAAERKLGIIHTIVIFCTYNSDCDMCQRRGRAAGYWPAIVTTELRILKYGQCYKVIIWHLTDLIDGGIGIEICNR